MVHSPEQKNFKKKFADTKKLRKFAPIKFEIMTKAYAYTIQQRQQQNQGNTQVRLSVHTRCTSPVVDITK